MLTTKNLYKAAAIVLATGIYPDRYGEPDDCGIVSVFWKDTGEVRAAFDAYDNRTLRICPRAFMVVHLNFKKTVIKNRGPKKDEEQ